MHDEPTTNSGGWLTVEEAAQAAGVSANTDYDWIERRRLRSFPRPGARKARRIAESDLARALDVRRVAAAVGVRVDTLKRWG
jgi:excisionase family DNA binding protein